MTLRWCSLCEKNSEQYKEGKSKQKSGLIKQLWRCKSCSKINVGEILNEGSVLMAVKPKRISLRTAAREVRDDMKVHHNAKFYISLERMVEHIAALTRALGEDGG